MRVQSIVMTWNRKEYTKAFIENYLQSTSYPHTLLIVDNFSTDGTREYLKQLEKDYKEGKINTGNIKLKFRYYVKNFGPHRTENHFIRKPVDPEAEYYVRCYADVDLGKTKCKDWLLDCVELLDAVPRVASIAPLDRDWDEFITENGKTFIGGTLFEFSEEIRVTRKSIFEEFGRPRYNIWSWTATDYFNKVRDKYITAIIPTWRIFHFQDDDNPLKMEHTDAYKKHILMSRRVYSHPKKWIEATGSGLLEWEEDGQMYCDESEMMYEVCCPSRMLEGEYLEAQLDSGVKERDIKLLEDEGIKVERWENTEKRYPWDKN